jgi:hypothetical protein
VFFLCPHRSGTWQARACALILRALLSFSQRQGSSWLLIRVGGLFSPYGSPQGARDSPPPTGPQGQQALDHLPVVVELSLTYLPSCPLPKAALLLLLLLLLIGAAVGIAYAAKPGLFKGGGATPAEVRGWKRARLLA